MPIKLIIAQSNLTLMGGAERVLLKIAQHYNAKIYTAEYEPNNTFKEFKDLDVQAIGRNRLLKLLPYGRISQGLNYGLAFYNLKLREDYDVINAHMAPSHWIRNRNERVLWYCHTPLRDVYDLYEYRLSLKKPYQKPIYKIGINAIRMIDQSIVKNIEFIFANSKNTESRIAKYYGRKDAEVLNGGINYKEFRNNGDYKYFLYPSRISPNKRQEYAISSFRKFRAGLNAKEKDRYKLIICGAVSKDKAFQEYYKKIKEEVRKTQDVQIITGASEKKLAELYSKATAVLYPPLNEDYGLVPLEAMASWKPVIAVNEGGPKETVLHGKTGFLVNSENEMAEKMKYIAEHPSIASDIGKNGRKHVEKNYSWEVFFKKFDKKLQEIKKGKTEK